jgi:hypothetical protein
MINVTLIPCMLLLRSLAFEVGHELEFIDNDKNNYGLSIDI